MIKKALIIATMLLLIAQAASAAIVCTITRSTPVAGGPMELKIAVVASNTGTCSLAAADVTAIKGKILMYVKTVPGATAPTTLYDLTITDADGHDITGTAINDRSATVAQAALSKDSAGVPYFPVMTSTAYTLNVTNNSQAGAIIAVYLVLVP